MVKSTSSHHILNWCVAMNWKATATVHSRANWISVLGRVLPTCMRCSKLVKFVRYLEWKTHTHNLPGRNSSGNQFRTSDILHPRVPVLNSSQGDNSYCTCLLGQCSMWWMFGKIPFWPLRLIRHFPDASRLSLCPVLQQTHPDPSSRSYRAEIPNDPAMSLMCWGK